MLENTERAITNGKAKYTGTLGAQDTGG